MSGKVPDKLLLMGSDTVRVTTSDALRIELEGNEADKARMRFVLDDDAIGTAGRETKTGCRRFTGLQSFRP